MDHSSSSSSSSCRPRFWGLVFLVVMFGELLALVPNEQNRVDGTISPTLRGVLTTPNVTDSVSMQRGHSLPCGNKTSMCEELCSICASLNGSRAECYTILISICNNNFHEEMAAVNSTNWCTWDKVKNYYNKFTECTENMAECLLLPWPNKIVENYFVKIHTSYFQECPTETLRDPPPNVVFALVMTPICLIPAMVVLVVLKTKNGDRRS